MKWRDSAGLTIAVTALLGFSAQPVARWIVNRTVSQFASGAATTAGNVSWDPVSQTWTCSNLRIETGGGEWVQAARATVRLDANELFRRNLVIDSAKVDGMILQFPQIHDDHGSRSNPSISTFPEFSLDAWADTVLNQHKSDVLSASQRRDRRRLELRQQMDRLLSRCAEIESVSTPNPLRSRRDIQEVRREVADLLQALAEERIRTREADHKLAMATEKFQEAWRDDLAQSVVNLMPEKSRLVQHIVDRSFAQYWESRGPLIAVASSTGRPLQEQPSSTRGRDVSLPGLPKNHLKIRSANLSGMIEIENKKPIRFRASITGWGDEHGATEPQSKWHFEMVGTDSSSTIEAVVGRANRTDPSPVAIESPPGSSEDLMITWTEHTDPALTSRGHWQTTAKGDRFDLTIPVDSIANLSRSDISIAFEGKMDWQSCWNAAMENYRGRYLSASLLLASRDSIGSDYPCHDQHPEANEESLVLVSEIWERTLANYLGSISTRMQTRIGTLHTVMEQFRTQCWSEGAQQHHDFLADLEREAQALQDNWDDYGSLSDRLARMRGSKEGF